MEIIAALLLPLSKKLQSVNLDIFKANTLINEIVQILSDWRSQDDKFNNIFEDVTGFCHKHHIDITMPRK